MLRELAPNESEGASPYPLPASLHSMSIATGTAAAPDSLQSLAYTYDAIGNIVQQDDKINGVTQS
jgi:hypothetical protein